MNSYSDDPWRDMDKNSDHWFRRMLVIALWTIGVFVIASVVIFVAIIRPSFARDEAPAVFLMVTLVMPEHQPDVRQQFKENSLEDCWKDAKEFIEHGVPKSVDGAVAVMAGCLVPKSEQPDL